MFWKILTLENHERCVKGGRGKKYKLLTVLIFSFKFG